jgi:hypothetical protein
MSFLRKFGRPTVWLASFDAMATGGIALVAIPLGIAIRLAASALDAIRRHS